MKQNDCNMKRAALLAIAVLLLFLSGCKKADKKNAEHNILSITDHNPEQTLNDARRLDEVTKDKVTATVSPTPTPTPTPKAEIIGQYKTYYGDSSESRCKNIENAAKKINQTILKPGEEFSCREIIAPFTEKNGYKPAGTFSQGKVVQSIGGGVCQISSTLYNAALEAELKITERAAHSMTVSYVDVGMDAAIAGDYKDLKFKNSLKNPITIHATTEDGWLIFEIEGIETRDKNRKIEFDTVILSTTEPGDEVVTVDKEQEENYRKVTQSAHTGYEAELYKVIYEDDIEKNRILVNKSSYEASPRHVTVGRKSNK